MLFCNRAAAYLGMVRALQHTGADNGDDNGDDNGKDGAGGPAPLDAETAAEFVRLVQLCESDCDRAIRLHLRHKLDHLHCVHPLFISPHLCKCLEEARLVRSELLVLLDTKLKLLFEQFLLGKLDAMDRKVRKVSKRAVTTILFER